MSDSVVPDFDSNSKRKKKKTPFALENICDAATENPEISTSADEEPGARSHIDDELTNKKKKKKKNIDMTALSAALPSEDKGVAEDMGAIAENDRDYTYEELLKRVFGIMREKTPGMVAGEKKRITMKPPQVMRVGVKKSSFANFVEICKMLHRQPKHLQAFLLAELGTSGSLDGTSQLIIKGRFQQKQIESVLRQYIKEYVTCHTCQSPDTLLQKDMRLYFLRCEACGSRCSVTSIRSGFQAITSKRAAARAKTN